MTQPPPPLPPIGERELAQRRRSFVRLMLFFSFVFAAVIIFQIFHLYRLHNQTVGDGRSLESYGYDLSNLTVDRDLLVPAGLPKDGRLTLIDPQIATLDEVQAVHDANRTRGIWSRIVVDSDVVIGVALGGEARAYPLRYAEWHEIINDELGGVPIAVTYHPLCASAVVFDRRIGGRVHKLGFSGLLYNSNLVMYDKQDHPQDESLWSQLAMRPIAGPAVERAEVLPVLPIYIGNFEHWRAMHPQTTVFKGDSRLKSKYKDTVYQLYLQKKELIEGIPVRPMPPADSPHEPWEPVMARLTPAGWQAEPYWPVDRADAPTDQPNVLSLWWAWHAIRGSEAAPPPHAAF